MIKCYKTRVTDTHLKQSIHSNHSQQCLFSGISCPSLLEVENRFIVFVVFFCLQFLVPVYARYRLSRTFEHATYIRPLNMRLDWHKFSSHSIYSEILSNSFSYAQRKSTMGVPTRVLFLIISELWPVPFSRSSPALRVTADKCVYMQWQVLVLQTLPHLIFHSPLSQKSPSQWRRDRDERDALTFTLDGRQAQGKVWRFQQGWNEIQS